MSISKLTQHFFGKPIQDYDPKQAPNESGDIVYRLSLPYDDDGEMSSLIEEFLGRIERNNLQALVIGSWGSPAEADASALLQTLIQNAPTLPNLRALFIGDITYEECEISWICQTSYNGLLEAYPKLEELRIRGGQDLEIATFKHSNLRALTIETGGLPSEVAQALAASSMPALEHLELWLGSENYGFSGDVALYQKLVDQLRTPGLRFLGLRDSEIADEIAVWLAGQAWITQLETLDLSLGTLGDIGAQALLDSQYIGQLKTLNLSHHYISETLQEKLAALPCSVILDDPQEDDEDDDEVYRYVAVGE